MEENILSIVSIFCTLSSFCYSGWMVILCVRRDKVIQAFPSPWPLISPRNPSNREAKFLQILGRQSSNLTSLSSSLNSPSPLPPFNLLFLPTPFICSFLTNALVQNPLHISHSTSQMPELKTPTPARESSTPAVY